MLLPSITIYSEMLKDLQEKEGEHNTAMQSKESMEAEYGARFMATCFLIIVYNNLIL